MKTQDLALEGQVREQALGVMWHVHSDHIGYNVCDKFKPITKRGILSSLLSGYDPLGTEGIDWCFNPPYASAHGGVWERQIRTVRNKLADLCTEQMMTEEFLPMFLCLAENIINNRPITTVSMDPSDLEPLTPNHLLLHGADNMPPGAFGNPDEGDLYASIDDSRHWSDEETSTCYCTALWFLLIRRCD